MIPYPPKIKKTREKKSYEVWLIYSNDFGGNNYYIKANSADEAIRKFKKKHYLIYNNFDKDGNPIEKHIPYSILKVQYLGSLIE